MKKINVLEVIGGMDMGGAETFLMNVLRNIDRNRFQLYFLVYGDKKFDYEDELKKLGGVLIRIRKPKPYYDFRFSRLIKDVILQYKIDIVHAHTYYNSLYAVLAAKKSGVNTIIVHSHNTRPSRTVNIIKMIYYRYSKHVINKYGTIFLACGIESGKSLFYKKNHFTVIDNGIMVEKFRYSKSIREKKRKELNIADNTDVLLHVGRFDRQKNHFYLLDVFNKYLEKRPDSVLLLVGDGKERASVEKKVNDLHIADKVMFLGKRSDVNELLSMADVLVLPSLYEGLPVILIEAQANGIPIVASSSIDRDAGFTGTVEFLSIDLPCDSWADVIKEKVGERFDNYEKMMKGKYNMKGNVSKLENIYTRCCEGGNIKEICVAEQKEIMLDMLKYVDKICRERNIKYSLIGGSLIGAVRHHGFIPWDDDIDIILTQENYLKLKSILDEETGIYQTMRYEKNNNGLGYFKLIDTRTQVSEGRQVFDPNYGVFIDIGRYCQTSNNKKKRMKHYKQLKFLLKLTTISKYNISFRDESFVKYIKKLAGKAFICIIGQRGISRMYRKITNKYSGDSDSDYVINCWPVYDFDKDVQLKKNIEEYIDAKFENLTVMIFKNYDELLRTTFGDYMQLPPKLERESKHGLTAWWRDGYGE